MSASRQSPSNPPLVFFFSHLLMFFFVLYLLFPSFSNCRLALALLLMPKLSIAGSVRISEVARLLADKGYTFEPPKRSHFSDQQRMDEIQNALEKLKKAEKRKKYSRNHPDKHSAQQSAKPSRWGKEPTIKASATKSSKNWWDPQAQ